MAIGGPIGRQPHADTADLYRTVYGGSVALVVFGGYEIEKTGDRPPGLAR
jgi:hypothetical protein